MFQDELKIPRERVPILVGKNGEVKKEIENRVNVKLQISHEGDVFIQGEDGLGVFLAKDIVKAIGRGFNPDIALELLNEEFCFETIDIVEYCGKSKNKQMRMKARLIGTGGKARKEIEKLTRTKISIYGKTVCVIGKRENVSIAKSALERLLQGSVHGKVYAFIERQMKMKR